jgi:hypothetical protein
MAEVAYGECGNGSESATTTGVEDSNPHHAFAFFSLPFEIRLQIYEWIHVMHPVKETVLTPWYPSPTHSIYCSKAIYAGDAIDASERKTLGEKHKPQDIPTVHATEEKTSDSTLLCPYKPLAGMPTALLRANQQMYDEIRAIPFERNEFVYVNWFASGLWAARAFVRGLEAWQRDTMRYARLELLASDLSGNHVDEWRELCVLWSKGLTGLRLKIVTGASAPGYWSRLGASRRNLFVEVRNPRGEAHVWVESGLKLMEKLRCLEVELIVEDWDNREKAEWCQSLEDVMNESRCSGNDQVRVACVEKVSQHT